MACNQKARVRVLVWELLGQMHNVLVKPIYILEVEVYLRPPGLEPALHEPEDNALTTRPQQGVSALFFCSNYRNTKRSADHHATQQSATTRHITQQTALIMAERPIAKGGNSTSILLLILSRILFLILCLALSLFYF